MENKLLSVNHIKKSFGGVHALKDVSLSIGRGEILCLAGENGCGKSTLIKVISGYYKPDGGEVIIEGKKYASLTPAESIRAGVSVIYQDFSLFPNLSVIENLALGYELSNGKKIVNYKRMRATAQKAMEKIGLQLDMDARVGDFSVADRQMIAIARTLVSNAKLIIMDEATSALTRKEVNHLFDITRQLKSEGVSIIFVSHKLDEVFEISDKITIFRNGEHVISCDAAEMTEEKFSFYMTGREFAAVSGKKCIGDPDQIMLETKDLSQKGAFEHIDLQLCKGEILGITGQLGCGRTELANTLFGLQQPDSGQIYVEGNPVKIDSVRQAKELGIAYVPEDRLTEGLFMSRSLTHNEMITHLEDVSSRQGFIDEAKAGRQMEDWIDRLSIAADSKDTLVSKLSGGNQQKVVLAKWLATNPKILILNGPTAGVDIGAKHDIYQLLREYAEQGMAIIVASDDVREVKELCSRVLVLKEGRMVSVMSGEDITEEALAQAAL